MKKRNTWQKEVILQTLKANKTHPTINELYNLVNENHTIGRATVYRNVNDMLVDGKIKKISHGSIDHYDGDISDHYHLICRECHRLVDVFDDNIDDLKQDISVRNNIDINQMYITIEGLCSICKNRKEGR